MNIRTLLETLDEKSRAAVAGRVRRGNASLSALWAALRWARCVVLVAGLFIPRKPICVGCGLL